MPASEKDWSVLNIRHDGARSSLSVWKKWKSRTPVFKSWVTFDPRPPEPLYFSATYEHPKIGLRYFEAQRSLVALQGQNNLWLAGLYTHDVDSHESAILSAVKVAERLDPQSANLKRLIESRSF
jgi:predicted NAD/FAD-binding protein